MSRAIGAAVAAALSIIVRREVFIARGTVSWTFRRATGCAYATL